MTEILKIEYYLSGFSTCFAKICRKNNVQQNVINSGHTFENGYLQYAKRDALNIMKMNVVHFCTLNNRISKYSCSCKFYETEYKNHNLIK